MSYIVLEELRDIIVEAGQVIKFLRKKFGMTQDELAIKLRVNKSSVQKYESGAVKNLKVDTIRELCSIFHVPPWLFVFPEYAESEDVIESTVDFCNNSKVHILNSIGIAKVKEYVSDLSEIERYCSNKSR